MNHSKILPLAVMAGAVVVFLLMIDISIGVFNEGAKGTGSANTNNTNAVICPQDAKVCPDGTTVSRIAPDCDFPSCPTTNVNTSVNVNSAVNTNTTVSTTSQPAVIYTTTLKLTEGSGRSYPTYQLWRKVGNGTAEKIVAVGKLNEYPTSFVLSPDHNLLAVNLEYKVALVDLALKTVKTIITAKSYVGGMDFSADSKELIVWDQFNSMYTTGEETTSAAFEVHRYNVATGQDTIAITGTADRSYNLIGWRNDGYLVLSHVWYPSGWPATLNLATGKIQKIGTDITMSGNISTSRNLFSEIAQSVNDPCNEYSGSGYAQRNIRNSLNGTLVAKAGDTTHEVDILAYAPDDSEILFSQTDIPETSYDQCGKATRAVTYYRQKLSSGQPVKVTDPVSLLSAWDAQNILVSYKYSSGQATVLINGQDWKLGDTYVVAQYYVK